MTLKNEKNLKRNWLVASKLILGIWRTSTPALKNLKNYPLMSCFWPNYMVFEIKSTEELCLMAPKIDANFEGKLTIAFKNDMRNLANFHQSTRKSQNWNLQTSYVSWQWRIMQNLKRNWLVQNWHEEFDGFWSEHSKISKICTLMGCFWWNGITFELKK